MTAYITLRVYRTNKEENPHSYAENTAELVYNQGTNKTARPVAVNDGTGPDDPICNSRQER